MKEEPVTENIRSVIESRFAGVLMSGFHTPDGQACALEAASVARGTKWTDDPETVGLPDLRPINDGPWSSDAARTESLIPVLETLWGWRTWPKERQVAWGQTVARRTIGEVLPIALRASGLEAEAAQCERELNAASARAAARAAARSDAWAAVEAARLVAGAEATVAVGARVALAAVKAARAASNSDDILRLACRIWIEASR